MLLYLQTFSKSKRNMKKNDMELKKSVDIL
jgi:hypothetical protein